MGFFIKKKRKKTFPLLCDLCIKISTDKTVPDSLKILPVPALTLFIGNQGCALAQRKVMQKYLVLKI